MDALEHTNLINKSEAEIPAKTIINCNRYILYYFSASWCSSGQEILPIMKRIYLESNSRKLRLEIIYVSFDTNKNCMMKQFKEKHGAWYAIPFGDIAIEELKLRFGVTCIPFVIVSKTDGTIITTNGKKEIDNLGVNVLTTWIE